MQHPRFRLLGAACGWGAKVLGTEFGPEEFKRFMHDNGSDITFSKIVKTDYSSKSHSINIGKDRLKEISSFTNKMAVATSNCVEAKKVPITIGGDHSIAIGTWSGVVSQIDAFEHFGLIWIDAHMDSHTYETSLSKAYHGMPLAALMGFGEPALTNIKGFGAKIDPKHLVLIGVRNYEEGEYKLLKRLSVKIYFIDEVKDRGFKIVFDEAKKITSQGTKGYGISLDLDAFDPEILSGFGSPEPNGLDPIEVMPALVNLAKDSNLRGFEIAEYNPSLDKRLKTAGFMLDIISKILA